MNFKTLIPRPLKNLVKDFLMKKLEKRKTVFPKNGKTFSEISVMITHHIGGGTVLFVQNFLQTHKDEPLFLFWYWYCSGEILYFLQDIRTKRKYVFSSFGDVARMAEKQGILINKIYVNSLVGFKKINQIHNDIMEYKSRNPYTYVEYFLHDFHALCPVYILMKGEKFCGLACEANGCEVENQLKSYGMETISEWQSEWEAFFEKVDEIRAFSKISSEIFLQKYPSTLGKITVVPHSMDYCRFKPLNTQKEELVVGICGAFGFVHKGTLVVQKFLQYAKQKNIRVVVAGPFPNEGRVQAKNIVYTGKYKNAKLGEILAKNGVNALFFPSIWPETFSYLVSELMLFDIPIAAFDIGAQGEKIRSYKKGVLLKTSEPTEIAESLWQMVKSEK